MTLDDLFIVVGQWPGMNIQLSVNIAAATGNKAVLIPGEYTGTDTFTNPSNVPIIDLRKSGISTGLGGPLAGGGHAIQLQTNGVNNGSQSILNLLAGSNITLSDNGSGGITISATGGGSTINFSNNETPSGTVDGVNTAFTLAHTPASGGLFQLFRNGQFQQAATDYTRSGTSITYLYPPDIGDVLSATYTY